MLRSALLVSLSLVVAGCTCNPVEGPDGGMDAGGGTGTDAGPPSGRCETDLTPFFTGPHTGGARITRIEQASQLLQGPNATGRIGDYLLTNDRVRVVVQAGARTFGPLPYGGTIIDADLAGPGPANDQFGEIGLLYNFGRTMKPDQFDLLSDGLDGGSGVIAVSGNDTPQDYLSIRNTLISSLGRVPYADPYVEMPARISTYFVINPGESKVRMVTAICSTDRRNITAYSVGDLVDPGYVLEFFNPRACTFGFGFGGLCFAIDQMTWFGYQGDGLAYGYSTWKAGSPQIPEPTNGTLSVSGITGTIIGANGLLGLGEWVRESRDVPRGGELRIPPLGFSVVARDFWVAKDLGALSDLLEKERAAITGTRLGAFSGTITRGGQPVSQARVVFEGPNGRNVYFTDAAGHYEGTLPTNNYQASAWVESSLPSAKQSVVVSTTPSTVNFALVAPRRVTVNLREANGGPLPGRLTVLCPNGPCANPNDSLRLYTDVGVDPLPDQIAFIGWIGASGTATFEVPSGEYVAFVTHGPEYSMFPNTYPTTGGHALDLRTSDATINAVLARVIDTTGWMSVDLHVHAVASPDSIITNAQRVLSFAGDGVEILVGTDHDVLTDFGPTITQAGLGNFLTSVIGEEASPMEWGHYNLFPLTRDSSNPVSAGALDWAGGDGPTLTVGEIFAEARRMGARTIQVNHARGTLGGFTALQVDTDTLATHLDPALLRMTPQTGATPEDTKLIDSNFDAFEVLNPADDQLDGTSNSAHAKLNDWFTLVSRGLTVAGTGVSDTHYGHLATGWRTWVDLGVDQPSQVVPAALSTALNASKAVVSNAPFLKVRAYRVDAQGTVVTMPVGIGGTVAGPDTRELGVSVEFQVPEYLDVTRVELYMHTDADDGACPIDGTSPRAATTRVACKGLSNTNWPTDSIAASQVVSLTAGDREVVTSEGGTQFRRYRKQVLFRLPAPSTDNWVVAMVHGTRPLAPLLYSAGSTRTPAAAFAFSNPIFIDADGNGYDHPPFRRVQGKTRVSPQPPVGPVALPSPAEQARRWGEAFGH